MVASLLIVSKSGDRVSFEAIPPVVVCAPKVDPGDRKIQIRS
jgi:hypothetical protein